MEEFQLEQNEIDLLIQCPKNITGPPKKEIQLFDGYWRNDMKLQSADGSWISHFRSTFGMEIRINLSYSSPSWT